MAIQNIAITPKYDVKNVFQGEGGGGVHNQIPSKLVNKGGIGKKNREAGG